jgi:hypothetical protein
MTKVDADNLITLYLTTLVHLSEKHNASFLLTDFARSMLHRDQPRVPD